MCKCITYWIISEIYFWIQKLFWIIQFETNFKLYNYAIQSYPEKLMIIVDFE